MVLEEIGRPCRVYSSVMQFRRGEDEHFRRKAVHDREASLLSALCCRERLMCLAAAFEAPSQAVWDGGS